MEKASPKPFYYLLIVTALSRYKASSSWSTLWMCENKNHATSTVSVPDLPSPLKEDQCLKQLSKTMQELYIPCCYYCTFKNIVLREDQSTQPRMTNPHPTNLWFPSNCLGANGPWTKKCRRLTVLSWIVHNKTLTGSVPSSEEPQERILSFCECRSLENFARFSLQGHQNSLQNKKSIPWFLLKKLNSSTDYFPARAQHCDIFLK